MTFYEVTEDGPEWGCPRYAPHAGAWFIDWFNARGIHTGGSRPTREGLEWINANPEAVAAMQAQCLAWFNAELDKIIPY